jgi:hypothetical protein
MDKLFGHDLLLLAFAPPLPFCSSLQQANKAIIVASTKNPAYTRKNFQLVQVNAIRMLYSLIVIQCCIGDGCVQSASFVICRVMDTRSVIFLSRLVGMDTS